MRLAFSPAGPAHGEQLLIRLANSFVKGEFVVGVGNGLVIAGGVLCRGTIQEAQAQIFAVDATVQVP